MHSPGSSRLAGRSAGTHLASASILRTAQFAHEHVPRATYWFGHDILDRRVPSCWSFFLSLAVRSSLKEALGTH